MKSSTLKTPLRSRNKLQELGVVGVRINTAEGKLLLKEFVEIYTETVEASVTSVVTLSKCLKAK